MKWHDGMGIIAAVGLAALAGACAGQPASTRPTSSAATAEATAVDHAIAVLRPTEGNDVKGTVRFSREADGVRVSVHIEGLTPGEHGFHVHEYGDCSSPDGTSAGGHFNPLDQPQGGRDSAKRHVGDLGNVTANDSGVAEADFVDSVIALDGAASIIGRGMIVHAGRDDLTSQPSGAAGPRVACGVIGIASGSE
jgi:Cu-Zn family superoxide dismutase